MRIVVTGKTGQVVTALIEASAARGLELVPLGRPELDLENADQIVSAICNSRADIVINAAAFTAVDQAEQEPARAMMINATGAAAVAKGAAIIGAPIIHLSTDYVFSGAKISPYTETDFPDPRSVYGHTKLAGERLVAASNARHVIVRTSWVYAPYGQNFLRTMLRLAHTKKIIGVVGDQRGCPTYAPDIADALLTISERLLKHSNRQETTGIFHMTGTGETAWATFAKRIFQESEERGGRVAEVQTITTAEYPTAAHRPANSCMDCSRLQAVYGITLPHWTDALSRCLDRLIAPASR